MNKLGKSFREKSGFQAALKALIITVLTLAFLIPLGMIRSQIRERRERRDYSEDEIVISWGGEQSIGGPVLTVPYLERIKDAKGYIEEITRYARFLPDILTIKGQIEPELRHRGIYEVTLYTTDLTLTRTFSRPDFSEWRIPDKDILWEEAFLSIAFPDMRAIRDRVSLSWDTRTFAFRAGAEQIGLYNGEIWTAIPDLKEGESHDFSVDLKLRGGRALYFLPLGDETKVNLTSPWSSPGFTVSFLPTTRDLSEEGFIASWYVTSLGRNYPQKWKESEVDMSNLEASRFGVNLVVPVDTYLKSTRSVKYGLLFIVLPFLTFFLFELLSGKKIHPFQYLLVGFAVCIFYLLLLSLSEHLGFNISYLLASSATIGLISFYSSAVLITWRKASMMTVILCALYIFLYVVLQSEDYALLIGSLGLFGILGAVMLITRKLDWYGLERNP